MQPSPSFTVLTWNVLAQAYVLPERYPLSTAEALAAGPRRARLLARLAALPADVVCLQEVEPDAHDAIAGILPDHTGSYAAKRGRPDGCALYVRTSGAPGAFDVHHREVLHYDPHGTGHDHVAALAVIAHRDGAHAGRRLGIASTHLRWQPERTPLDRHLGVLQMRELLARVRALDAEHRCPAWVLCGDLNALSQSPVVRAATDQGFALSCQHQRPWDTVNIDRRRRKLDYLLYTAAAWSPQPDPLPALAPDTPMPSEVHPSDHLPVRVAYDWR